MPSDPTEKLIADLDHIQGLYDEAQAGEEFAEEACQVLMYQLWPSLRAALREKDSQIAAALTKFDTLKMTQEQADAEWEKLDGYEQGFKDGASGDVKDLTARLGKQAAKGAVLQAERDAAQSREKAALDNGTDIANKLIAALSRVADLEAAGAEYVEDTDARLAEHRAKFGAFERRVAELDAGRLELLKRLDERLGDTEELAYALMSEAIARGTARWREKTGRTDVLPDTAALTSWLLDDMQKTERRVAELERLILKVEECLRGHLIGINCHGPKLDERTQVAWHAALTAAQKPGEEGGG